MSRIAPPDFPDLAAILWNRGLLGLTLLAAAAWVAQGGENAQESLDEPSLLSLAPPLVAIGAALLWRSIIPALLLGVWCGAWALTGRGATGLFTGLLDSFQVHVLNAVADRDHATILLFSMMIGGMAGICLHNGGMQGLAAHVAKLARTRRRGQGATASLGLVIFFDDYANMMIIGQVMRPITDRLRISREKLAYLVDSTAAPVAAVALATTWIGFEVGTLEASLQALGRPDISAYGLFLRSLAYSYYPFLTLFLVFLVSAAGRDFGAMAKAEKAAITGDRSDLARRDEGADQEASGAERRRSVSAAYALLPIGVLVAAMLVDLMISGTGGSFRQRLTTADPLSSLLRASLLGAMAAVAVTLWGRRLSLRRTMDAWSRGVESVLPGLITLVLAWALAETTEKLGAAAYLGALIDGNIAAGFLPPVVFLLAALVALATGSAWGTMGLLMPLAIPLVWQQADSEARALELIAATAAAVLGGAVFGDHCSPVSDTTILSATACGCDHLSHVRTQLPYALVTAGVATLLGTAPASLGVSPLLCLATSGVALTLIFLAFSKPSDTPVE